MVAEGITCVKAVHEYVCCKELTLLNVLHQILLQICDRAEQRLTLFRVRLLIVDFAQTGDIRFGLLQELMEFLALWVLHKSVNLACEDNVEKMTDIASFENLLVRQITLQFHTCSDF